MSLLVWQCLRDFLKRAFAGRLVAIETRPYHPVGNPGHKMPVSSRPMIVILKSKESVRVHSVFGVYRVIDRKIGLDQPVIGKIAFGFLFIPRSGRISQCDKARGNEG